MNSNVESLAQYACSKVMLKYFRKFAYDYEAEVDQNVDQIYITLSDPTFGDFADKLEVIIVVCISKAEDLFSLSMGEDVQTSETAVESFDTFIQLAKVMKKIQKAIDGKAYSL